MAYVFTPPPSMAIRLPKRRWNTGTRAGLGQTCSAFQNWVCAYGGSAVQSVLGTPCSACVIAPVPLAPGSTSPPVPVGYDATTGTVDTSNTTGATGANPYVPLYADNPGGDVGLVATCDWTAVDWTSPSTWCAANWGIVGLAVVGVIAMIGMRGKR